MRNVISLVLGGGRGTRLSPLTKYRAKPAVPLAGKYRLIDIPLSNCINSGLNRIYVLTQFLSVSLHRHIRQAYRFDQFSGGFVELLAAQQTEEADVDWYQGTADAVRKNIRYLEQPGVDYVVILSGDQLYRMDYREMIETHKKSGAEVTIAGIPVTREAASALGVMRVDDTGRIAGFLEKPQTEKEIEMVAMDPAWIDKQGIESQGRDLIASMGIYVFNRDFLVEVLSKTAYRDFGKEVFPAAFRSRHVQLHLFDGYWEDIGTIRSFFEANLSLAQPDPPFQLLSPTAPIFTRARYLPPTQVNGATVTHSLIADGCHIGAGAVIENSIIGLRCMIGENAVIRNSIIMGADMYEGEIEREQHVARGESDVGIGPGAVIEGAIVDKNVCIGKNVRIVNDHKINERPFADGWSISDGIPVIAKDASLGDGWVLSEQ
ncbi:glucose-1-phosphate adenylyltransferase [Lignipirellula cremea]|uniref:Glucose-1-phosphate adenylyltransferase n=1 Tax=Lignipirellula cremea TaxID=2528010 RepID=A0A518DTR5_9BACT|nr:glucose-1-phosphate adenylyltransferase [Lignipirellula cremea]QDU95219.1 Glucose-1-phosphate adenylyltransferase [Lignipirellula cremea]